MKSRKFPKKKVSQPPRPQIEIIERKDPPLDLEKQGQYSDYWKKRARAAQIAHESGKEPDRLPTDRYV